MKLDAVVFDFDGVIVDTEHLHFEALNRVLQPLDLTMSWEDYIQSYIGLDDRGVFLARYQQFGRPLSAAELAKLMEAKAQLFHHMVSREPPTPFPGSVELIRHLSGKLPLALCSGALRSDIEPVFAALQLHGLFDRIVTADDVSASKPDPTCYRLAVEHLSAHHGRTLEPSCCLAIEDTPTGITAAMGAGLKVLALTNSYDRAFLGLADVVRDSLAGLSLASLKELDL